MSRKCMVLTIVAVAVVMMIAAVAQADPFDDPNDRPFRKRERLRERIELMKMWRLTEALDLDEETAAKLFPMLREQKAELEKLRERRRDIIRQLDDEVSKEKPEPEILRVTIEKFKENERETVEMRNRRLGELSKILSDEQIAKMIISVPRFEREMKDWMLDARGRQQGRRGGPMQRNRMSGPSEPMDLPRME